MTLSIIFSYRFEYDIINFVKWVGPVVYAMGDPFIVANAMTRDVTSNFVLQGFLY